MHYTRMFPFHEGVYLMFISEGNKSGDKSVRLASKITYKLLNHICYKISLQRTSFPGR